MTFPVNHKTVLILDHGPNFSLPCDQIDFDFHKSRVAGGAAAAGYIPSAPVMKTMWTCASEAVLEYCRIIWDLFPGHEKMIRFVVAGGDDDPAVLNSWTNNEQNTSFISSRLAKCGRPEEPRRNKAPSSSTKGILAGLKCAIEALCEVTDVQKRLRDEPGAQQIINRGRIVCITNLHDDRKVEQLVRASQELIIEANQRMAHNGESSSTLPINQVVLDIVHCSQTGDSAITSSNALLEASSILEYQVYSVDAGQGLAKKLLFMAFCHYQLASTTVTGIPMKEEQNASSSANYDVELFHQSSVHSRLINDGSELVQTIKEGCEYKTITLKWCIPRGPTADLHHCTGTARITPMDVNSRPSLCLTNYLLSGRSVMLEMPARRVGGGKTMSHMLTSHGGEIFIHTLSTTRSLLDDPPAISDSPGGRVTDYRINDLKESIAANRLAPYYSPKAIDKARNRIARTFRFCPYTISSTTIFNMSVLEPLQNMMMQEELSEDDLAECRKIIFTLMSMENKGDVLPVPVQTTASGKAKTMKKEEQYRFMFAELERFLACHDRSEKHSKVLECLLESRNKPTDRQRSSSSGGGGDKVELDVALREIERYSAMTEREKNDFNMSQDGVLRATTDSPLSPPATKRFRGGSMFGNGGRTLLEIWNSKIEMENSRKHVPFAGHRNLVGDKAKLYLNLEKQLTAGSAAPENN